MGAHREGYKGMGASAEGQRDRYRARTPPCMMVCPDLTWLEPRAPQPDLEGHDAAHGSRGRVHALMRALLPPTA